MTDEFTHDVLLSHSAKDKAVVRPLAERLRADGLKVWFDDWVLQPGDSIPAKIEEGLEFTDNQCKGIRRRLYLQLKAGNSWLPARQQDDIESFDIEKQAWVKSWLKQPHRDMLVISTLPEDDERSSRKDKLQFVDVRWMEISSVLQRKRQEGRSASAWT
jgi:hypothetical protein